MRFLRRIVAGFRALFRRARHDDDLDAELRAFFEASVKEKLRAGLRREAAVRAARIELGSVDAVKDHVRDVGWESVVEGLWQDLRYGVRMLRRSPGFSGVTIGILALGIGANTAIFSLVNTVLLRQLPVRKPSELVQLVSRYPGEPYSGGFPWRVYEHIRDHNHVFSELIACSPARFQVSGGEAEDESVDGQYVTANFFSALGVQPAMGRSITAQDDRAGAAVAVLSWSYWQRRFNHDPKVLGKQILVDGVPATVVGVAPREFLGIQLGSMTQVWNGRIVVAPGFVLEG